MQPPRRAIHHAGDIAIAPGAAHEINRIAIGKARRRVIEQIGQQALTGDGGQTGGGRSVERERSHGLLLAQSFRS
jgi:hypothetical protein